MLCVNPTTEQPLEAAQEWSDAQIQTALTAAEAAFEQWRSQSFAHRGNVFRALAKALRDKRDPLAQLMAIEMGKPITAGEQEIEKCAWTCEYFAEHAQRLLSSETIASDAAHSFVRCDPLGPILAIMPWNFPFWQVFRFAAPALMAGNTALLKHAPNVPGCAVAIEQLFADAGAPAGLFASVVLSNEAAAEVIAHPAVRAVTLTGSERAGSAVAAAAGKALKKTVLELGGSDAFIVLEDADIPAVARSAAASRCINSGQSCIAAKRFIVLDSVADDFEEAMTEAMAKMRVGEPLERTTQVGPIARLDLLENLDVQVQVSVAAGARLLTGGRRLARKGFFYPPTVLADVRLGMPAFDDETFGPVAAIVRAASTDEAIRLGNQSRFGLAASIWTQDLQLADQMAAQLEAGCVFVNGIVKSDARLPFGGIRNSGYGRELGQAGIREFVNLKTVWVG